MDILKIFLTLLAIMILIFTISKKAYAPTALLAISFIILLIYSVVTGKSVMDDATIGSWFLDIFEYIRATFVSQFVGLGMTLLPIVGYATYMGELKASDMMTYLCTKPLKKIKNPYIVLACAVVLVAILMIAIPSHTGLTALMMTTVYPILISLGVSKISAVSAIVLGGCLDMGPAAPDPIFALSQVNSEMTMAEYFVKVQIPILGVPLLLAAVLCAVINYKMDKKMDDSLNQEKVKEMECPDAPKYYAVFPLFPIIFILIFSKLVIKSIIISVCGAVLVSWALIIIIDMIRKKSVLQAFDCSKALFAGMGSGFINIMPIIVSASVFAASLQKIGGIAVVADWLSSSKLPFWAIILLIAIASWLITFCVQAGQASISAFAPSIMRFSEQFAVLPEIGLFPAQITMGLGRGLSPIGVALNTGARYADIEPMEVIKRNVLPAIGTWLLSVVFWGIFLL